MRGWAAGEVSAALRSDLSGRQGRAALICSGMWEMLQLYSKKEPNPLRDRSVSARTLSHWTETSLNRRFNISGGKRMPQQVSGTFEKVAVCIYERVSYHWMISVIWASQWATLSFLSASSLISSSSCLLELLIFSYMVVSYRNENKRGGRRACY